MGCDDTNAVLREAGEALRFAVAAEKALPLLMQHPALQLRLMKAVSGVEKALGSEAEPRGDFEVAVTETTECILAALRSAATMACTKDTTTRVLSVRALRLLGDEIPREGGAS